MFVRSFDVCLSDMIEIIIKQTETAETLSMPRCSSGLDKVRTFVYFKSSKIVINECMNVFRSFLN